VPDGALNYVSFGSLPVPGENAITSLAVEQEIVIHPSASALAFMRSDARDKKAPNLVAIFADPIFSTTDVRILGKGARGSARGQKTKITGQTRDFMLALENGGLGTELPRLPFSRREADSIFKSASGRRSIKNVDFEASKEKVFASNLDQYQIVHFASHGLIDGRNPALSGIVLSLVEKEGAEIDGFLRLQDIYNLKLNADLVVLSACRTALGKEVRGEGIVGIARGFMYAGAPRVVVSLWKVDDAATAYLMSVFYRRMLVDNMRPAAALRAAQNEMKKQKRWSSPYFWAPFVLQGEWK
jgi:CHAT domain-containing protein